MQQHPLVLRQQSVADLKHVGRVKKNQRKCAVVFRTLPNEPESCLILPTENLSPEDHDDVIALIESNSAQTSYELAEAMDRAVLRDGSRMLPRFHGGRKLVKMSTSEIEMTPNTNTVLLLSELNEMIATQRGVGIGDLTVPPGKNDTARTRDLGEPARAETVEDVTPTSEAPLTDDDMAAQYRSQADALFKEAKRLREQAEDLVPTKRKTKSSA
jgi:hypothetical protein